MPRKDANGVDTYDNRNYSAPVHAVIGMAGFTLDKFSDHVTNFLFISLFSRTLLNIHLFIYKYIHNH